MARQSSRRDFLQQVIRAIRRDLDFKVSSRFKDTVSPFGVEGAVIRVAGILGKMEFVAADIDRSGVRTYDQFPASGVAHVELLIYDDKGEIIDHRVSCDARDIVDAIRQWKRYYEPRKPKKPLAFTWDDLKHYSVIAQARADAKAKMVVVSIPSSETRCGAAERLRSDLANLARDSIARNFPRLPDGRLPLGCTVLLAHYEDSQMLDRDRMTWLAAHSPAKRSEPQFITIQLSSLIGQNHPHNWASVRWYWDGRHQNDPEKTRWGVPKTAANKARFGTTVSIHLKKSAKSGKLTPGNRAALCMCWLDHASAVSGFNFGVE